VCIRGEFGSRDRESHLEGSYRDAGHSFNGKGLQAFEGIIMHHFNLGDGWLGLTLERLSSGVYIGVGGNLVT
jgi:hypothetical protein